MIEGYKFIIADIMTKEMIEVAPDTSGKEAAAKMKEGGVSSLVVKEKGELVGIITDKDYVKQTSAGKDPSKFKVGEMMSTNLISVDPKLSLREAAEVIREHNIRHLLVKSSAGFVGIVSVKDILSTLYEEIREQNRELKTKVDDLEKFYKIAIDREIVMVKLKKRIHDLEMRLGEKTNPAEYLV